jgi:chemotaxis protein CheD
MADVGAANIHFVLEYLRVEGYQLFAQDVGGTHPRKVLFHPLSGKVRVKKIRDSDNETIRLQEDAYLRRIAQPDAVTGEIEMFDLFEEK